MRPRSTRRRSAARRPQRAKATANAASIEPGDYPVVLETYAVVDVLDMLGYLGFSALAVQEGRSFVELGKQVGSELVTIRDDGADPAGLPMAFDYEGVAKQRVDLLTNGVCTGVGLRRPDRGPRRGRRRPGTACRRRTRTGRSR